MEPETYIKTAIEEELPKEEGYYFVWWIDKDKNIIKDCSHFKNGKFFTFEHEDVITHWLKKVRFINI